MLSLKWSGRMILLDRKASCHERICIIWGMR
jgi:hypothetical protein